MNQRVIQMLNMMAQIVGKGSYFESFSCGDVFVSDNIIHYLQSEKRKTLN